MKSHTVVKIATAVCLSLSTSLAHSINLSGTLFDNIGRQVGLDPVLLYSVALAESALGKGSGTLGPHPWTLRSSNTRLYAKTRSEAELALAEHVKSHGPLIDIGLMQVNYRWHRDKVADPTDLLDPLINMTVAGEYLADMIYATPDDLELAIGKYHVGPNPTPENTARARNYGSRVIAIYRNLLSLGGQR